MEKLVSDFHAIRDYFVLKAKKQLLHDQMYEFVPFKANLILVMVLLFNNIMYVSISSHRIHTRGMCRRGRMIVLSLFFEGAAFWGIKFTKNSAHASHTWISVVKRNEKT